MSAQMLSFRRTYATFAPALDHTFIYSFLQFYVKEVIGCKFYEGAILRRAGEGENRCTRKKFSKHREINDLETLLFS